MGTKQDKSSVNIGTNYGPLSIQGGDAVQIAPDQSGHTHVHLTNTGAMEALRQLQEALAASSAGKAALDELPVVQESLEKIDAVKDPAERKSWAQKGLKALGSLWKTVSDHPKLVESTIDLFNKVGPYMAGFADRLWTATIS